MIAHRFEQLRWDPKTVRCYTADPNRENPTSVRWSRTLDRDLLMLGLPTVSVPYALQGTDATVIVKLWEYAPGDCRDPGLNVFPGTHTHCEVLVTAGVYRLVADTPSSSGVLEFQLDGNHWLFEAGHDMRLEITQGEIGSWRPDAVVSTLEWGAPQLLIPGPRPAAADDGGTGKGPS